MVFRKQKKNAQRKGIVARSKILREISIMLVAVMIISGLVTFFIVRHSQEQLIEKSIDKMLAQSAEDAAVFFLSNMELLMPKYMEIFAQEGMEKIAASILSKELSYSQSLVCEELKNLAEAAPMGINLHMVIVLSNPDFPSPRPFIFACSDKNLVYDWEIPVDIAESLERGEPYVYREEGIPELGLEGEHLVITARIEDKDAGYVVGYVGIKPLAEEVATVNQFYDRERRNTILNLGLVVGISVLVVIFVSYFILNVLIRKRITQPIEQLASSAERIMEGDLDVDIQVHEGGDFAVLERTFKEMLESIRRMFDAAFKED